MSGKVFRKGPIKSCGRKPLKNLKEYDLLKYVSQILLDPF